MNYDRWKRYRLEKRQRNRGFESIATQTDPILANASTETDQIDSSIKEDDRWKERLVMRLDRHKVLINELIDVIMEGKTLD